MESGEGQPRGRGRPRAEGADDKILDAALAEYTEHGWAGFTMDGVARRAGFGKSTLYLRWHDKDALLTDAVRLRTRTVFEVDTGSLPGDLEALATTVFHDFADPEGWAGFRMVVDTASSSQPLGNFTRELSGVHRDLIDAIFTRARERSETTAVVNPFAVTDLIYGAALFFTLGRRLDHQEVSEEEIISRVGDVVAVILHGIDAQALQDR